MRTVENSNHDTFVYVFYAGDTRGNPIKTGLNLEGHVSGTSAAKHLKYKTKEERKTYESVLFTIILDTKYLLISYHRA